MHPRRLHATQISCLHPRSPTHGIDCQPTSKSVVDDACCGGGSEPEVPEQKKGPVINRLLGPSVELLEVLIINSAA